MANTSTKSMGVAIRGPRRLRATDLPPEPTVEVLLDDAPVAASSAPPVQRREASRTAVTMRVRVPQLQSASRLEHSGMSHPKLRVGATFEPPKAMVDGGTARSPLRKALWFVGGVGIGVLIVALVRGNLMHEARALTSTTTHALQDTALPTGTESAQALVETPSTVGVALQAPMPCHEEVKDPCALLPRRVAAPVTASDVPTFRIEESSQGQAARRVDCASSSASSSAGARARGDGGRGDGDSASCGRR